MTEGGNLLGRRLHALIYRLCALWALAGGAVLVAVVLVVSWSVASNALFRRPVPGDFEIVEVGIAVAVFSFLPYGQMTGANVTADIFTSRAGPRTIAVFSLIASAIAFAFAGFLAWRMFMGLLDMQTYRQTTMVYQFPLWIAFVPIVASLGLLALAALSTLFRGATDAPLATLDDPADR